MSTEPISEIPGLVRAENLTPQQIDDLCAGLTKPHYSQEEVYGAQCFVSTHIAVPYDVVFDYCVDVPSLVEWTVNVRRLEHVGHGLFRGRMVFSVEDAERPSTDIYLRVDAMKGPEQGLVCYPCAWDQGKDLWMRYYFVLTDAMKTVNRPGTMVLWVNCRHPYYDRTSKPVPSYVEDGRARTDRPWAGDGWHAFPALHQLELANLKKILEHRHRAHT